MGETGSKLAREADSLKRPPRGYPADSTHIEDLKRKSFYLMTGLDAESALSSKFVSQSARIFRSSARLNHFINDALGLPF
jgi:uncharacterized protein (DUF2461 family)